MVQIVPAPRTSTAQHRPSIEPAPMLPWYPAQSPDMPPTANGEIRPTVARDADEQEAKRIRHDGGKLYKFLQARQASLR